MKSLTLSLILVLGISLSLLSFNLANAINVEYWKNNVAQGQGYLKGFGTTTSNNATLTKYLQLYNVDHLSLIATGNVSFANGNIVVSVSDDNSTWHDVDTVAEGSGVIKGIFYSDAIKATTVPINPALFPYLKIVVPDPAPASETSLTWSSGNEASVS